MFFPRNDLGTCIQPTQVTRASALCHVFLSIRMEQRGSQWREFREIMYLSIFQKLAKVSVLLIADKNEYLHVDLCTLKIYC